MRPASHPSARAVPLAALVLLLAATPGASCLAGARLEPVDIHREPGGHVIYACARCVPEPEGTLPEPLFLRSPRGVWILRRDEEPAVALARIEGPLPEALFAVSREGEEELGVNWGAAPHNEDLPAIWRFAVRSHFQELLRSGEATGFARHVLSRLDATVPARPGDRSFLEAQNALRSPPSAFELTTGAVAVEESLQLERLRGTGRDRSQAAEIPLATIQGVEIRSHPWEEMLQGRQPEPHPIERFLPLDQYAFEARSFAKFLELSDWLDAWGSPLLHWFETSAEDARVKARLERQICLPASALARTLGPLALGRVALTGNDPFLREGSDVTLIFELKAPALFRANLEKNRLEALAGGARRLSEKYREHTIEGVVGPRRRVSSFSTEAGGHALVSNSLAGLKRVLDAWDGKIPSQDEGLDRRYVRTLLPAGEGEDAFLYLSDPFIRRLVGPELKLRESRRLECAASLRSLSHALLWRRLRGAGPTGSVEELVAREEISPELLWCPDGGRYELADPESTESTESILATCSLHGSLEFLTPNVELELVKVTQEEKQAYERFRDTYQRYWSRFFDPIGIQVTLGAVKRFETVILPLIEMSEYRELADLFGGSGAQRGPLPEVGEGMALFLSAHINRESRLFRSAEGFARTMIPSREAALGWVGDRASLFLGGKPPEVAGLELEDLLEELAENLWHGATGGVRIEVRNRLLLAGFLASVKGLVLSSSPGAVSFETLPEYKGVSLVRVAPEEGLPEGGPEALYYGLIGDGLCLSFNQATLEGLIDRQASLAGGGAEGGAAAGAGEPGPAGTDEGGGGGTAAGAAGPGEAADGEGRGRGKEAPESWLDGSHLALALLPGGAPAWRELLAGLFDAQAAMLCSRSAERLAALQDWLGLDVAAGALALYGAVPRCPSGGELRGLRCSVHGGGAAGRNPLRRLQALRARLTFTTDGVRTLLEVEEER